MKVLFDTNALIYSFTQTNYYEILKNEYPNAEIITLEACIKELKRAKPRIWEACIKLGELYGLKIKKANISAANIDTLITRYAKKENCCVFTFDRRLKKKLKKNEVCVVSITKKGVIF